jgi:integrase/recombinase XerD
MAAVKFPYLVKDTDRHGNVRYYVRRPGMLKIRILGDPSSSNFLKAYHDAIAGKTVDSVPLNTRSKPRDPESFAAVCLAYYASPKFKRLDASTQSWQRRYLDQISSEAGEKPIKQLEARHIRRLRDARAEKPSAANHMLKALRALFRWAEEEEIVDGNPAARVTRLETVEKGHHSWETHEVQQFENCHPIGSKARLAMALLLYTAARREDVVRFGRQNIRSGRLRYTQAKNEHRKPIAVDIPVHPTLSKVIEATSNGNLTFLTTEYGKPFSSNGFGNKFRQWCDEAGLPQCSAHGLRKAAAARLVEAGCSPHEVMAITGHQSLEEVERYTRAANRPAMADSAFKKLRGE